MRLNAKQSGTGGSGLKALSRDIMRNTKVKGHKVGWPQSAKYPSGVPVANVALWNEFGVPGRIPERPFFRNANSTFVRSVPTLILKHANRKLGLITQAGAHRIAMEHVNDVKKSIVRLKTPPNDPATIAAKGSSNPLVDTGLMLRSVDHELIG